VLSAVADVEEPDPAEPLSAESLEHPTSAVNMTSPDIAAVRALVIFFELFCIAAVLISWGNTSCVRWTRLAPSKLGAQPVHPL